MAGWAAGQRGDCCGVHSLQQGALCTPGAGKQPPVGQTSHPVGQTSHLGAASEPASLACEAGLWDLALHPRPRAWRLLSVILAELHQPLGKASIPGAGERDKALGMSPRQQGGRAVPRAAPSPSASSSLAPIVAVAGSWGKDLKIVVGPVYASSAKRLINAAGTENQFFKAEINNNN